MCGICLVIQSIPQGAGLPATTAGSDASLPSVLMHGEASREARELLQRRGPDALHTTCFMNADDPCDTERSQVGLCTASVLAMRGPQVVPQPLFAPFDCENSDTSFGSKSFLCWNGEVFSGLPVPTDGNDGAAVLRALLQLDPGADDDLLRLLASIHGPFAFVFWQADRRRLWFGRDPLGRRSLLVRGASSSLEAEKGTGLLFALSSCAFSMPGDEAGVWQELPPDRIYSLDLPLTKTMQCHISPASEETDVAGALGLPSYAWPLPPAVLRDKRTLTLPGTAKKPDPFVLDLPAMFLPRGARHKGLLAERQDGDEEAFLQAAETFHDLLKQAVERRVTSLPPHAGMAGAARVAVLFSGGVDSMLLAALADDILPAEEGIDLINVAFGDWPYDVPDRITGRASARQLAARSPSRRWRFIEVNVTKDELQAREKELLAAVEPRATVMDMTIGPALWFAAQGQGIEQVRQVDEENGHMDAGSYDTATSSARVLLLGHGADEQLAGYGRHRGVWRNRGMAGLQMELERDVSRLWFRNLGRDDRVISSVAKESRLPFLDVDFMKFLNTLPLSLVCDMTQPSGVGDKRILRHVAATLGLSSSSALPKRAMQFGSRIAHLTKRKAGGHVPFTCYTDPNT